MDGRFSFFPSLPFPFNGGNLLRNLLFIEGSEVFNLCRNNLSPPFIELFFFFFFDNNDIVEEECKRIYIL